MSTKLILLFIAIGFAGPLLSQTPVAGEPPQTEKIINGDSVVFEKVDIEASFTGGDQAWLSFLQKNLNGDVPVNNGAPGGSYNVTIQFIVDKDGKLSAFKALTNHGFGMEAEVIRILKKSPPWNPASLGGRKVKAYRLQPVIFWIEEEKRKKKRRN